MESESMYPKVTAIDILLEQHKKIREFFREFEETDDAPARKYIVDIALAELAIYITLEEEFVYPAVRETLGFQDELSRSLEEHHVAKVLMAELRMLTPEDEHFTAKFRVLAENVSRHIREEESEFFPVVELNDLDLVSLGRQMSERKKKLMENLESSTLFYDPLYKR